jgi:hypothetical protein
VIENIDNRILKSTRIQDSRYWILDTGYWIIETGYKSPVIFVKSINEKISIPGMPKVD